MIAAWREEKEFSGLLYNTIRKLLMTLDDINKAAETDEFIVEMKKQVQLNEKSKKDSKILPFSNCSQILTYADRVVIPTTLQRRILKEFHSGHPGMSRMKALMCGYTYWPQKNCKRVSRVSASSKGTTCTNTTVAEDRYTVDSVTH